LIQSINQRGTRFILATEKNHGIDGGSSVINPSRPLPDAGIKPDRISITEALVSQTKTQVSLLYHCTGSQLNRLLDQDITSTAPLEKKTVTSTMGG
jgi:hypothetical protein